MMLSLLLAVTQPAIHLVWYDPYSLVPAGFLESIGNEVETLFERNGIKVRMYFAQRGDADALPRRRINVIVSPTEGHHFGLADDSMAAAVGVRSSGYSIFLFHPSVRRTLGHQTTRSSPRQLAELSIAIGRIVAHELVHVLVPERGHTSSGLMSRRLTRKHLTGKTLSLDAASRRLALSRAGNWFDQGRTLDTVPASPYLPR
ncbi:MAG TPA: hypothetical protein VLK65_26155 [Vicinamibacteria bacterium]|nr:hypothetical protein [Vicinamibacteria bacterium]